MATEKYGFDELTSAEANKFVTYNQNLRVLEAASVGVIDRNSSGPPGGTPSNGDAYIVDSATGDWSSFTVNDIAFYVGGSWFNITPVEGMRVWVNDEDIEVAYDGSNWVNSAATSLGVAALTDDSVTFVSSGVLVEDTSFTYDTGTNTLSVDALTLGSNMTGSGDITIDGSLTASGGATFGSNVTVTGDFTVTGTATSLNVTNLDVDDPLIVLGDGNATDSLDLGIILERSSNNQGMIWDESADEFAFISTTEDGSTAGNVTIADYSDVHVGGLTVDDILTVGADLGINNSSPNLNASYTDVVLGGGASGSILTLQENSGATTLARFAAITGGEFRISTENAGGYMTFRTDAGGSADEAMRLDVNQKVGIGTLTNPIDAKLEVVGDFKLSGRNDLQLLITNLSETQDWYFQTRSTGNLQIRDGTAGVNVVDIAAGAPANSFAIDSSGKFGLQTNLPNARLEIEDGGVSGSIIQKITADDATVYGLVVGNDTYSTTDTDGLTFLVNNSGLGVIESRGTSAAMRLRAPNYVETNIAGTEITRVDSSGLSFDGGTNHLNDYVEAASWTPVVADASTGGNTGTFSFSDCIYVRIGDIVFVNVVILNIDTTGMTGANAMYIRGLPFTSRSNNQTTGTGFFDDVTVTGVDFCATIGGSDTWITFLENNSGGGAANLTVSDFASGTADIRLSLWYFV